MTDPVEAVQTALYAALSAGLSCPVYDRVPKRAAYPYVVIDRSDASPDDPLSSRRDIRVFYLSVWSTYPGQKGVLGILAAVDAALHNARPAMATGRWVTSRVIRKSTQREPDGETFQGQAVIEITTEH